jgi:hypothetical protein
LAFTGCDGLDQILEMLSPFHVKRIPRLMHALAVGEIDRISEKRWLN